MAKYVITGHSDDLVCIEGDRNDEFSAIDRAVYLMFSDGTVVQAEYCPDQSSPDYPELGEYPGWNIWIPKRGEVAKLSRVPLNEDAEVPDPYWDTVTVEGDLKFVGCFDTPDGPSDEWIYEWFENHGDDLTPKQRRAAYLAAD